MASSSFFETASSRNFVLREPDFIRPPTPSDAAKKGGGALIEFRHDGLSIRFESRLRDDLASFETRLSALLRMRENC
jgi:hypothetical protein